MFKIEQLNSIKIDYDNNYFIEKYNIIIYNSKIELSGLPNQYQIIFTYNSGLYYELSIYNNKLDNITVSHINEINYQSPIKSVYLETHLNEGMKFAQVGVINNNFELINYLFYHKKILTAAALSIEDIITHTYNNYGVIIDNNSYVKSLYHIWKINWKKRFFKAVFNNNIKIEELTTLHNV